MRKHLSLVLVSLALILCLTGTAFAADAANNRVLTATFSFSKPIPLGLMTDQILAVPDLTVEEVYYTYSGERPIFGGVLPPEGLSTREGLEFVRTFYKDTVLDLSKGAASASSTNLEQRLADLEHQGVPIYGIALKGPARALRSLEAGLGADSVSFTNRNRAISAKHVEYPKAPRSVSTDLTDTDTTEMTLMAGEEAWSPAYGSVSTYTDASGWRCIYNELTWLGTSVLEFESGEGYEHDFVTYNYDDLHWAAGLRGTARGMGLGWESNLPAAYLDYATVDDNPDEPVYTVGTFDGTQLYSNTEYYTFLRAYPGNASSDTAKIVGQKMTVYAWSVWTVFVNASDFLTDGWSISVEGTDSW